MGKFRVHSFTPPAAGAQFFGQVPDNRVWRVITLVIRLVNAAVAANRQLSFSWDDGDPNFDLIWTTPLNPALTSGQTGLYRYANSIINDAAFTTVGTTQVINRAMPELYVKRGFGLSVNVSNIQAADEITGVNAYVEEWLLP